MGSDRSQEVEGGRHQTIDQTTAEVNLATVQKEVSLKFMKFLPLVHAWRLTSLQPRSPSAGPTRLVSSP